MTYAYSVSEPTKKTPTRTILNMYNYYDHSSRNCIIPDNVQRSIIVSAPPQRRAHIDCDVNCHKKCEKLTANLCGVNQKLIVEALSSVRRGKYCGECPRSGTRLHQVPQSPPRSIGLTIIVLPPFGIERTCAGHRNTRDSPPSQNPALRIDLHGNDLGSQSERVTRLFLFLLSSTSATANILAMFPVSFAGL